jgi:hypothetical protein
MARATKSQPHPASDRDEQTNPAQVRGDVQAGVTGDKVAGFDPAAAPLETDSEAGGASMPPVPRRLSAARDQNSATHGSAMRELPGEKSVGAGMALPMYVVAIIVIGIVLVSIAFFLR